MKIKSQKDFVSGLALIAVGVAFAIGATNYNFGTSIRPGPGYFPFGLGIILAILGAVVLFEAFTTKRKDGDPIGRIPWRPLICIVGAIAFFGYFLPKLGFMISFPAMIVITSAGGSEFRWKDAILNAVVLTALSYAIFIYGLQLTIPVWPA
ncbi:tripartite tricarboxylate transporter TctB family protein [Propionivibrio sp.]|jgi:drug/metabolite transporter (DMT)-like permease|uniref:tripartite tricarboxylate transporter TctB family protein n=1 Tax=Propionivibrio sp. TaxID=2212460 RepID=UPI0039E61A56